MYKADNVRHKSSALASYASEKVLDYQRVVRGEIEDDSQDSAKVFFHRERFSSFLRGQDEAVVPITYEMWPSLSCDARCPKCTYSINRARSKADNISNIILADFELFKRQIDLFSESGINSVILTGGGEPTLHPNLANICHYIKGANLKWGMFTHGLHMTPSVSRLILESSPSFIRFSLNGVGAEAHDAEYRLGLQAWHAIKRNIISTGSLLRELQSSTGVAAGFALEPAIKQVQLDLIRSEIFDIFRLSGGGVSRFSFRPKVVYYKSNGEPKLNQKHAGSYSVLSDLIRDHIQYPLEAEFGKDIRIENKKYLFQRVDTQSVPATQYSMFWSGQVNHKGDAYILSELNGSPWQNTCLGNVLDYSSFKKFLSNPIRRRVLRTYFAGANSLPINSKLTHVEKLLSYIRAEYGRFSEGDVNEFWEAFDAYNYAAPPHWDFL